MWKGVKTNPSQLRQTHHFRISAHFWITTLSESISLLIGIKVCVPHICISGKNIDELGRHGLTCKHRPLCPTCQGKSTDQMNHQTWVVPETLETAGCNRADGRHPMGWLWYRSFQTISFFFNLPYPKIKILRLNEVDFPQNEIKKGSEPAQIQNAFMRIFLILRGFRTIFFFKFRFEWSPLHLSRWCGTSHGQTL